MRLIFLLLIFSNSLYAVDFGTGAEGNCSDGDFTTARTYNCANVTITGPVTINTGTVALVIKATGSITIGNLTVSANNGDNGAAGYVDRTTATGLAGGFAGGNFLGAFPNDQRTGGNGAGPNGGTGGAGGTAGTNGAGGTGGGKGTGSLSGGSGGGAGGSGDDGIINTASPGTGGAGGGFITLAGQQGVTVNGTISANGGNGGNGFNNGGATSGGGGGGTGGSILIRTFGSVDLSSATIALAGGNAGAGGDGTNAGTAGATGRLRLETVGGSSILTSGLNLTAGVTIERADLFENNFEGKIATGCGSVDLDNNQNGGLQFLLALLLIIALPAIAKIKSYRRG